MSANDSQATKKRDHRLKAAVERSESTGWNAHYISKGGVSLKSNALTEMVQPMHPVVVQRRDIVVK